MRGLKFEALKRFDVGVMVPKGHRFAKQQTVTKADVVSEPLALFGRKQCPIYHDWLRSLFGAETKYLRMAEECDTGQSLIAAVECGPWIAICSEGHTILAGPRITFIPFAPSPPPVAIGIGYLESALASPLTGQFIETARAFSAVA